MTFGISRSGALGVDWAGAVAAWTEPTSPHRDASGRATFALHRSSLGKGSVTEDDPVVYRGLATTFLDTAVDPGRSYTYAVRVLSDAGQSRLGPGATRSTPASDIVR